MLGKFRILRKIQIYIQQTPKIGANTTLKRVGEIMVSDEILEELRQI